jgi:hypothetical protein
LPAELLGRVMLAVVEILMEITIPKLLVVEVVQVVAE